MSDILKAALLNFKVSDSLTLKMKAPGSFETSDNYSPKRHSAETQRLTP
jgi:hypothetical protein